jgi:hypothetical protein
MSIPSRRLATQRAIEALNKEHPKAIPVFMSALHVKDIGTLIDFLPDVLSGAKFYRWHETPADTCRTFCHLCFIDPTLVEAYIGMRFEQLVA